MKSKRRGNKVNSCLIYKPEKKYIRVRVPPRSQNKTSTPTIQSTLYYIITIITQYITPKIFFKMKSTLFITFLVPSVLGGPNPIPAQELDIRADQYCNAGRSMKCWVGPSKDTQTRNNQIGSGDRFGVRCRTPSESVEGDQYVPTIYLPTYPPTLSFLFSLPYRVFFLIFFSNDSSRPCRVFNR